MLPLKNWTQRVFKGIASGWYTFRKVSVAYLFLMQLYFHNSSGRYDANQLCFCLFQAEVNYLGQLSHPNLVKLIGYCCEDEHRLLVYEYMACGSLEKHLFRRRESITNMFSSNFQNDASSIRNLR